jgi:hypothetical protein
MNDLSTRDFAACMILCIFTGWGLTGCGADDDGYVTDGGGASAVTDGLVEGKPEGAVGSDGTVDGYPLDAAADSAPLDGMVGDSVPPAPPEGAVADTAFGTLIVSADASVQTTIVGSRCAAVNLVTADPDETTVGHAVGLTASGVDPDNQTSDVTLTWTSSGAAGSLTGVTGTSTTFSCTSVGTATITVMAAIADGGASCPTIGFLTTTVRCDAP